jgi:hypothetical protein
MFTFIKRAALICYLLSVISSCDQGDLGGADKTVTYYPEDAVFAERMNFMRGVWYSRSAGGLLDGYRIRRWGDLTAADKAKAQALFPEIDVDNLQTYSANSAPQNGDYVFLFDDSLYGQEEDDSEGNESFGLGYMGLVRAINIFNGDKNRGAIIIEYFKGADPSWLSDPDSYSYQGLAPGEKPFSGIYYKVLSQDSVQMANPLNLATLYSEENKPYYTEQETLANAVGIFNVENEAEFINWVTAIPQDREK